MPMKPTDAPTSSTADTDDTPTTSVPGHTVAIAAAQRWTGVGALVRLLQHEIPHRDITMDRKTAQLWRNTLEHVIKNIPSGQGGATTKQIKLKLAKAINGASRTESLKYPSDASLSVHELMQDLYASHVYFLHIHSISFTHAMISRDFNMFMHKKQKHRNPIRSYYWTDGHHVNCKLLHTSK